MKYQTVRFERYFYPRPPRGGRPATMVPGKDAFIFLSTPSARRATTLLCRRRGALPYFYPRPPRGGRPATARPPALSSYFYPRPPRGGRLHALTGLDLTGGISIHALREEGDGVAARPASVQGHFYPRPPRGGRRGGTLPGAPSFAISIHALREEGDVRADQIRKATKEFLSTPSARRATGQGVL